ncbi:MAG: hypothetical protein HDS07_07020 [Bacteroides sp.]|nr:hypothetical protein [Bacteroides sp.]
MKLRLIFFISIIACMLCSCNPKPYYQICTVASDLPKNSAEAFIYTDNQLKIEYDFWSNGGSIQFTVTNQSNEMINLDLSKSFCIKNGVAFDYFRNRLSSSSSTSTFAEITTSTSSSVAYFEKSIVSIPPHSSKVLKEYNFANSHFEDCDLYEKPSKNEESSLSFTSSNSPVNVENYITYTVGENSTEHTVINNFFISNIANQHYDATIFKDKVGCESDWINSKGEMFIKTSPTQFYYKYKPRTQIRNKTNVRKKDASQKESVTSRIRNVFSSPSGDSQVDAIYGN